MEVTSSSLDTARRHSPFRGVVSALWSGSLDGNRTAAIVESPCWSPLLSVDVLCQATVGLVDSGLSETSAAGIRPLSPAGRQFRAHPGSGTRLLSRSQREACVLGRGLTCTRDQSRETGIEGPWGFPEAGLRASATPSADYSISRQWERGLKDRSVEHLCAEEKLASHPEPLRSVEEVTMWYDQERASQSTGGTAGGGRKWSKCG